MTSQTTHRKRGATIAAAAVMATLAVATAAQANPRNSVQPGRTFFGQVTSGDHPNRLVTLHNGTGAPRVIGTIAIAGGGGFKFTLAANTPILAKSGLPRCTEGTRLAAGARCALDVRVHTVKVGWFRAVLRIVYRNGWMNSGSLEAHVVAAPSTVSRSTPAGSCSSVAGASEACS